MADRRRNGEQQQMEEIVERLKALEEGQKEIRLTLFQGSVDVRTLTDKMSVMEKAFPHGVDLHRDIHVKMAEAADAERRFWDSLKSEAAKSGVRALITLVIITLGLAALGVAAKFGWGAK